MTECLPERPQPVGISLSGGGVRAASFGLGAVQELQKQCGLLRGRNSADYISAVSGGSYIAGSIAILNAGSRAAYTDGSTAGGHDLGDNDSPVNTQTVKYLLAHSRYLIDEGGWRLVTRLMVLLVSSFVTFGVIVAWIGAMLIGIVGFVATGFLSGLGIDQAWPHSSTGQLIVGLSGLAWVILTVRLLSSLRPVRRILVSGSDLCGIVLVILLSLIVLGPLLFTTPYLIEVLEAAPLLSSPTWILENWAHVAIVLATVLIATIGLNGLARPLSMLRPIAGALSVITARVVSMLAAILLSTWAGLAMYRGLTEMNRLWIAASLGVLVAFVAIGPLPGLISPHRPYRMLIARGFIVRRGADGHVSAMPRADEISLSSLLPTAGETRYPELLICAAANLTDVGSTPAGANVLPLVISGETLSIPTTAGAVLKTTDLEAMRAPYRGFGLVKPRPMLSLAGAVAIAGAAVAPAMGRMTMPSLRPLLVALNIRLGVWLPNPLSEEAHSAATNCKSGSFSVGIDQLICELFGWHGAKSKLVYASDGGHYENLGLIELLRRQCSTIWAVDASVDKRGTCGTLAQAIRLAHSELDCHIDLDSDVFAARDASGCPSATWTSCCVTYSDGTTGTLHIVRLGLTANHSIALKRYASDDDKLFPYHSTLVQSFSAERFNAYRLLGQESMQMLLASLPSAETRGVSHPR